MDAARHLFLEEGFSHVSMRKIASKIGYTPTTIYLYFKNKEEILGNLLEEGYGLFYAKLKESHEAALCRSTEERLFDMCEAYIQFGLDQPDYYNLIFTENFETNIRSIENSNRYHGFLLLKAVVEELFDDQTFVMNGQDRETSALYISNSIWASLHGITALLITFPQFHWVDRDRFIQIHLKSMILGYKMLDR